MPTSCEKKIKQLTDVDKPNAVSTIKPLLKEIMTKKLDERTPWNYISIPDGKDKGQVLAMMSDFIENKLNEFLLLCLEVIPYFTQKDNESIGTLHPTENAQKFSALFACLDNHGFACTRAFNKPVCFWSGSEGKNKALTSSSEISDSKVPALAVMFDVCTLLHQKLDLCDIAILTSAISRIFAACAQENANVYLSTAKLSETPGFTIPNNFWLAELPTLMTLKHREIIQDIKIYRYEESTHEWDKGISLFSKEANQLPIRRRFMHPFDKEEFADRFMKKGVEAAEDRKQFYHSKARPSITYGHLKTIADEWHKRSMQHHHQDKAVNSNYDSKGAEGEKSRMVYRKP